MTTTSSASALPIETASRVLFLFLPESFDDSRRCRIESIIHRFLNNTIQHGYGEVYLTLTIPTSLTNQKSFNFRGVLECYDAGTPGLDAIASRHQDRAAHRQPAQDESIGRVWCYCVDAPGGSRSRVLLVCGNDWLPRQSDIHSHAALIGFSHILHNEIWEVLPVPQWPAASQALTAREVDTLKWTAEGKTASEIAQIIGISRRTVESHISSAMAKLGASTRSAAAVRAYGLGLLSRMPPTGCSFLERKAAIEDDGTHASSRRRRLAVSNNA